MGADEARPGAVVRRVQLHDGRRLTVRRASPGDVEGLRELFADLALEDRHRRFFSAYRPTQQFLEGLADVSDDEGAQLVAVVSASGEVDRLVAEAGYRRLPDGDGELGITAASEWRGWLGPFVLDALLEVAAADGVPNLEADVLVTNPQMLALVRSRGYAVMERQDPSTLRVLIATRGHVPAWPPAGEGPAVLVETPGGDWPEAAAARAGGLRVVACAGPTGRRHGCPALAGEPCPLAAGADVIVVARPREDDDWRALVDAHSRLHPGVPVCIDPGVGPAAPEDHAARSREVVLLIERLAAQHAGQKVDDEP